MEYFMTLSLQYPEFTWPHSVQRHPSYMKMLAMFSGIFAVSAHGYAIRSILGVARTAEIAFRAINSIGMRWRVRRLAFAQ